MPRNTHRLLLAFIAALAVGMAGCNKGGKGDNWSKASGDGKAKARELNDFAKAYHNFLDSERRPPQSFQELNAKYPLPASCAQATVYWGTGIGGIEDGPATGTVLAYLPNPDGPGKLVLFCDGMVDVLSDTDFAAARKGTPRTKR
jgi:hypothetical protein